MSHPPAYYLPFARKLRELQRDPKLRGLARESLRGTELQASAEDAAETYFEGWITAPPGELRSMWAGGTDRGAAWGMCVYVLASQCEPICPHHDVAQVALLAAGRRACRRSSCRFRLTDVPDDGCCDVCGQPSRSFTNFVVHLGQFIVAGDQCDACVEFAGAVPTGIG
jgi:hypothetical protein